MDDGSSVSRGDNAVRHSLIWQSGEDLLEHLRALWALCEERLAVVDCFELLDDAEGLVGAFAHPAEDAGGLRGGGSLRLLHSKVRGALRG